MFPSIFCGWLPLIFPVVVLFRRFNCPAVAEVLLKSGAKPSLVDALNNTALHHAVRRRNKDMVDLLVRDTDIDVNAKTQVGMTALHLVCMNGDLEICRTLLRHDADIRAKTADDSTPLHTAIFNCNTHLAELLIKQGQWVDFIKQLRYQSRFIFLAPRFSLSPSRVQGDERAWGQPCPWRSL